MISRKQRFGIVDFSEGDNKEDKEIYYCKSCEKYNMKVPLKNRIYPNGEPVPVDHSNFLQCHECGLIVPIYELEKESAIKDVVETIDNPFDSGKDFLGVDSRKARRKERKKQELFGDVNDEDAKRELSKGNTLLSYSEFMPQ